MSTPSKPFNSPLWQAIARETDLAVQLICSGANAIGRAGFAAQGEYTTAMFGFANGLERLGKLVLTSDSLLSNGKPLSNLALRKKGHSLKRTFDEIAKIEAERGLSPKYSQPMGEIQIKVLDTLDSFSDASRGRYANHESMNGHQSPHDPLKIWWAVVCEEILETHFRGTELEKHAHEESLRVGSLLNGISSTLYFHEDGSVVTNPAQVSMMVHERKITQQWGRYYLLTYARWLSELFALMTFQSGYMPGTEFFFGHYERLATLRVPDEYLLDRSSWPLTRET